MTSPTSRTREPASAEPALGKPAEVEELVDELLHRPIARRLVTLLARTPITPNQVTLLAALIGVGAGTALVLGVTRPAWRLAAGLLLFLSVVLDCADGQLARVRGVYSTTGAILDGIADYVVGVSVGIGAAWFSAAVFHSPWYWVLGLVGIASSAAQAALFDHAKTRYIARAGGGYREREVDLTEVARERNAARAAGRFWDAFLLRVYERYSLAQQAALAIPAAADPSAYRAANRRRMRVWTFLGIGTHFTLAYLLAALALWWPAAVPLYFVLCATALNLLLVVMLGLESRRAVA